MRLVYLPSYSPDLNPIEEGFSAMKAWIRNHWDYILGDDRLVLVPGLKSFDSTLPASI